MFLHNAWVNNAYFSYFLVEPIPEYSEERFHETRVLGTNKINNGRSTAEFRSQDRWVMGPAR